MRSFKVVVDGTEYAVDIEEVVGGDNQKVAIARPPVVQAVNIPKSSGGTEVTSPMPGMVVSFSIADGTQVKKGQVVAILEAMKMENDIVAPCDGKFKAVASKGANVENGAVLGIIE